METIPLSRFLMIHGCSIHIMSSGGIGKVGGASLGMVIHSGSAVGLEGPSIVAGSPYFDLSERKYT
jgi:hypothetical protein